MSNASDFRISKNGVLTKYTGRDNAVVIPDGVTEIGRTAFYNNYYLQSVKFPAGVKVIGDQAFEDCKKLEMIDFSDGLELIGSCAFRGCASLKSVVIPKGVTGIGMYAFYDCADLNDISIPNGVLRIGTNAFSVNTNLVDNRGFLIINGYLLKYRGNNSHAIIPEGVTAICNGAFFNPKNNDKIERISIPESVTHIGAEAFRGCRNLRTIAIPKGVTSIGSQTFTGCCNLERLDIPASVTEITKDAFDSNSPKLRIAIEDISILPLQFRSYAALCYAEDGGSNTDLRSEGHRKYIRSNVAKLIDIAVSNPVLLSLMCIEKMIPAKSAPLYLEAAQNSGNAETITLMLEYGATKLSAGEKSRAKKIQKALEDNITERKVMRQKKEDIEGLVFVVTGDLETFNNRTELKEFITEKGGRIATSLSSRVDYLIMNDASSNSEKSQKANELGIGIITEKQFNEKAGRQFVLKNDSVLLYVGNGGNIVIPNGVKSISSEAFMNCENITAVRIPDSVISIEDFAFDGCNNLIRVDILNTTTNIGDCAFGLCENLTIHAPVGSYAERFAKENNIPFVAEQIRT